LTSNGLGNTNNVFYRRAVLLGGDGRDAVHDSSGNTTTDWDSARIQAIFTHIIVEIFTSLFNCLSGIEGGIEGNSPNG
jgi:hypothetical protein